MTGYVWTQMKESDLNPKTKYKEILEIVDNESQIPPDLMNLADWMAAYYLYPVGIIINAMLPNAMDLQIQLNIRKTDQAQPSTQEKIDFLNCFPDKEWYPILSIKEKVRSRNLFHLIEEMEELNYIEVQRIFDQKIKKKYANFVVLNPNPPDVKLTAKQQEVYSTLQAFGYDFALAQIAHQYSYALLRVLVEKELIHIEAREIRTDDNGISKQRIPRSITLTDEQLAAVEAVFDASEKNTFRAFLLFGITGSGKTEVYIELIARNLLLNRKTLLLVPEISLTPQVIEKFYHAFGEDIAVLHSHLNDRQRWLEWKKIKKNQCRIIIGARSAIFAPIQELGLIIVDEEHENTYKQDSSPIYHGRDMAIVRAKMLNIPVLLGSATPSLESWLNAQNGKYSLLQLTHRPSTYTLPIAKILDMREEKASLHPMFSDILIEKISERLDNKEQVILFQNRRGYASFVQCTHCGKLLTCPHCDISMNYHHQEFLLKCHYCGYSAAMIRKCPECGSYQLSYGAAGTEQIEQQVRLLFPSAKILRMDADTTGKKSSYTDMFDNMKDGSIDILLGTQMISKGLDFANVTLVGIILADVSLNIPDFRASERTFQLLTQVAGRSGRGDKKGEVFIQTYNPEHYAITLSMQQDYLQFVKEELFYRKQLNYAPYFKMARFLFSHKNEDLLQGSLEKNNDLLIQMRNQYNQNQLILMGFLPAPLPRINDQFRYHLIIKAANAQILNQVVSYIDKHLCVLSTIKRIIDIDPQHLL